MNVGEIVFAHFIEVSQDSLSDFDRVNGLG